MASLLTRSTSFRARSDRLARAMRCALPHRRSVIAIIGLTVLSALVSAGEPLVLCFAPLPAIIAAHAAPEQTRRERSLLTAAASWKAAAMPR